MDEDMTRTIFLDIETFSEVPISRGTHAYAIGAETIVASYSMGLDEPTKVLDLTNDFGIGNVPFPDFLLDAMRDPDVTIVGHNFGNFDRNLLRYTRGIDIPAARVHDTMAQALSHGLPGGLDRLGEIFKVSESAAKIKEGRSLIQLFCKPRPKNMADRRATKRTHPIEWQRFLKYAGSDITAMKHIYKVMPRWNYYSEVRGNSQSDEYKVWLLDQLINDRGFYVDRELASAAVTAVQKAQRTLNNRTDVMTGGDVDKASQRDRLLKHLLREWGVELPDMQKGTLQRRVNDENLPDAVRELIAIRLEASATSVTKYNALLNGVSEDGRLRGTMQYCGASRTGRWAGRVFQPQNLPRPDMKPADIETGIAALKQGVAELMYDSCIKLASNAIRGSIVAAPNKKLIASDLSNIEGRVLAWLAGEDWKLKAFRDYDNGDGPDLYKITAGGILGKDPADVTSDERQSTGKVPELACGYQGSTGAFNSMAALYGLTLEDAEVYRIVDGWRDKHQATVSFWRELQEAFWDLTTNPSALPKRVGLLEFSRVSSWLRIRLPSGRYLCYADPKVVPDKRFDNRMGLSYMGLNSYTKQWERLMTYGGKIAENAVQAVSRDALVNGMILAEDAGYNIVLDVHDEIVAETEDSDRYSVDGLSAMMSRTPWWADNKLPLSAAGWEGYRYRK